MSGASNRDARQGSPHAITQTGKRQVYRAQDILVVDDAAGSLVAIEAALSELGYRLVVALSGDEALARLLEEDFALILLDVQMPGISGFETARIIRSRARNRHVPIIFMTASASEEVEVLEAYALGAVDFLFKPMHPEVLKAKASVLVELQQRTEDLAQQALEQERHAWEAETLREKTAEMQRINAQLAEADRRKDEFLAMLGHELRNPLAPIHLGLELLRHEQALSEDGERNLQIVSRQVAQLTRLVDDLLDVARITAGTIELRRDRIRLDDIVDQAIITSRPLIEEKRHVLIVRGTAGSDVPYVDGDSVRLTQVIANLLNNAARYTAPGGRIEIAFGVDAERAFVRVTDNGCGLRPEVLSRIFDMFVQERTATSGGGLGLGLSLARRLVELHGGQISANSEGVGLGSRFELRLPSVQGPARGRRHSPPMINVVKRRLSVVIVDDNDDIREAMTQLLERKGHVVYAAADGQAGLELIERVNPDVAFVDVGLPLLSGYEVAQQVRISLGRSVWLVAMTGFGQESDRKAALAVGFDLHLRKPASTQALEQAMEGAPIRE